MNQQPRVAVAGIDRSNLPDEPGVYAWYVGGQPKYVGKAKSLHDRIWKNHLGGSACPTNSAFRRNVAEYLGFGKANAIKHKAVLLSATQLRQLSNWIRCCDLAWITCGSEADAISLESRMKREFMPPLTKR
jgi:excinuclease UvrABC nuclease subunit